MLCLFMLLKFYISQFILIIHQNEILILLYFWLVYETAFDRFVESEMLLPVACTFFKNSPVLCSWY